MTTLNGIMARDRSITTDDIKQYYFKMPRSHRSIRRLHAELKEKFAGKKKIPSLATIFRHSKSENWLQLCNEVDNKSSAIAMDKIVEKKAVQLEEITEQLKETSDKALQLVLSNLKNVNNIDKVQDLVGLNKIAVESAKLSNLLTGNPTSISNSYHADSNDIKPLKNHIQELYQSINEDLRNKQQEKHLTLVKSEETKH